MATRKPNLFERIGHTDKLKDHRFLDKIIEQQQRQAEELQLFDTAEAQANSIDSPADPKPNFKTRKLKMAKSLKKLKKTLGDSPPLGPTDIVVSVETNTPLDQVGELPKL
eukprot:CAMPEP_0170510348 /NCGR_PEP_ID=MMETSP0208-20121228/65720_1 /TAXON_ID=197538 /ORGANISM="Strombidium inclinatum, Strain S3" /LENGTH=109 /DNA_ID=CAMNT_0010793805 /DNA_START=288 /DNA_END=617 /DNA_ORIENTATION=+